jgi:hypothetical protein
MTYIITGMNKNMGFRKSLTGVLTTIKLLLIFEFILKVVGTFAF